MRDALGESLRKLKWIKSRRSYMAVISGVLSLVVILNVFWAMRQQGLTLAGDADCGLLEHSHDDTCGEQILLCDLSDHEHTEDCFVREAACGYAEHSHSIACYSDDTADVESLLDWQEMFRDYPHTGNLRQDLVSIAQTQVGYTESVQNFSVDAAGIRHGYSRYGAWYGAPYGEWSAMFVSFCLHYAGADPEEMPGNTGANAMATIWEKLGKFAQPDAYQPVAGDLVFFSGNTVGIVALVESANFYVIQGDRENAVSGERLSLCDPSIIGWGLTGEIAPMPEEPPSEVPVYREEDLLDISNGPAVFIFEGKRTESPAPNAPYIATRTITDLAAYLEAHGGSYFFTLLDTNNRELPKDADGNYIAEPGISYKLTLTISNPDGFHPGTYQYQLPEGLRVNGGSGSFVLTDGVNVGTWEVSDDGLITMAFNENMNSRSEITISATMGMIFLEWEEPIDFDGKITVTIEKPDEEAQKTELNKWGVQGSADNPEKPDPSKLYWTIQIIGKDGSRIPGSILTDQILLGDHSYTASDMANGLRFGVSETDPATGTELDWHSWYVYPGDPGLSWDETGWTYRIPQTVTCKYCGELELGNNGWNYGIYYSSTPEYTGVVGNLSYMNRVTVDGQQVEGWSSFMHGETQAEVVKTGSFYGDADSGGFFWEFRATIPGLQEGEKAAYFWYIMDYLRIRNDSVGTVTYVENNAHLATVTATNNGVTSEAPNVKYATDAHMFAWANPWTANQNGIYYGPELDLLCRCQCTAASCPFWHNDACGTHYWFQADDGYWYTNGFCQCWAVQGDTTFTFSYKTDDPALIENYGGMGNVLHNEAALHNRVQLPDGNWDTVTVTNGEAELLIPGVFEKELVHDFDGYTANYKITVNEAKLSLTNDTPLTIHDVMTQTLAYISGSLVITTEDVDGNRTVLQQGTDYTVTYDGTGTETDKDGIPVHILDIVILRPQPVMYILEYDATLVIPSGTTQALKYSNFASISLWGGSFSDISEEKVYADINIAAKQYRVEMHKKDSVTGAPLQGATFGLFNAQGGLITNGVTDANGELLFETNVVQGIILREHVLYYMQELDAPPGFRLDDRKYWFCFCDSAAASCPECDAATAQTEAFRIPFEQIGKVYVVNEPMSYDLPGTGGPGSDLFVLVGVLFTLTPLVYGFVRRRKQERRGVG